MLIYIGDYTFESQRIVKKPLFCSILLAKECRPDSHTKLRPNDNYSATHHTFAGDCFLEVFLGI